MTTPALAIDLAKGLGDGWVITIIKWFGVAFVGVCGWLARRPMEKVALRAELDKSMHAHLIDLRVDYDRLKADHVSCREELDRLWAAVKAQAIPPYINPKRPRK